MGGVGGGQVPAQGQRLFLGGQRFLVPSQGRQAVTVAVQRIGEAGLVGGVGGGQVPAQGQRLFLGGQRFLVPSQGRQAVTVAVQRIGEAGLVGGVGGGQVPAQGQRLFLGGQRFLVPSQGPQAGTVTEKRVWEVFAYPGFPRELNGGSGCCCPGPGQCSLRQVAVKVSQGARGPVGAGDQRGKGRVKQVLGGAGCQGRLGADRCQPGRVGLNEAGIQRHCGRHVVAGVGE